jgi:predicted PurR-regulated permease PerM
VAALYWARVVLIPLVVAILFAFILTPVVQLQLHWRIPRVIAALLAVMLACAVVCGLGPTFLIQAPGLADEMANRKEKIGQKVERFRNLLKGAWLERVNDAYLEIVAKTGGDAGQLNQTQTDRTPPEVVPVRLVSSSFPLFRSAVANAFEILISLAIIVVLITFILVQREDLRNRLIRLWGRENLTTMTKALDDGDNRFSRFWVCRS